MEPPDPHPYDSFSSHASTKSKRRKTKKRRQSQFSNPGAVAPDTAASERSLEGNLSMRRPSADSASSRHSRSHKRKRRASSSSSHRHMSWDETKSSAAGLERTPKEDADKREDVPGTSSVDKGLNEHSKEIDRVAPPPSENTKQMDAPQTINGAKEAGNISAPRSAVPGSNVDTGLADDKGRQNLLGVAALCVLALTAAGAVLVLMVLLQTWDNDVRLHVPNLGVFLGTRDFVEDSPVYVFRAIRFGRGTSGPERFAKAMPVTKHSDNEINAQTSQTGCTQMPYIVNGKVLRHNEDLSEECLHLNIWTPCTEGTQAGCRKTVLVFFHSIEFQTGDNNYYDGQWLAGLGKIVVVSPNFRMGAFGFLKLGCPRADIPCAPGDVALEDQRLAVEWVVNNIASFGGNASDVVLMGSAAGAWSVGAHVLKAASDSAAGDNFWNHERFSKVILMSESPLRRYYGSTAGNLASALGCTAEYAGEQLLYLRNVRARDIVLTTSERTHFFGPAQAPGVRLAANVAGRRFLLGTVKGEGSHNFDIVKREPGPLQQNMVKFLQSVHHIINSSDLVEVYRNTNFLPVQGESNLWAKELLGDVAYTCPLVRLGEALASGGRNKVYGYVFDYRPSFTLFNESGLASRFVDLDFVFGRPLDGSHKGTDEERQLSRNVINIWTSFARSGFLPNIGDKPWPAYSDEKIVHVRIGKTQLEEVWDFKKKDCSVVATFIPDADGPPLAPKRQRRTSRVPLRTSQPASSANDTTNLPSIRF